LEGIFFQERQTSCDQAGFDGRQICLRIFAKTELLSPRLPFGILIGDASPTTLDNQLGAGRSPAAVAFS